MNELLELCMSKSPADLKNSAVGCLKDSLEENFINSDSLIFESPYQLNS